ncbi:MAG: AAA family ATPase [Caulobacterales bacterium]
MYLSAIERKANVDIGEFPWSLPVFRWLDRLEFKAPVTFLVGENGSGKSTLLEGLAAGMHAAAAGRAEIDADESLAKAQRFAAAYRFARRRHTARKLFVRAEDVFGFVHRVDQSMRDLSELEEHFDKSVKGDYGRMLATGAVRGQRQALEASYGEDPDARSHGETFLNLLQKRLVPDGLYFLDEPEAPLSPLRVLSLISLLKTLVEDGAQLIIATHSPILLAFPGAEILLFEGDRLTPTAYEDLDHVRLTRAFLNDPESFLRRL